MRFLIALALAMAITAPAAAQQVDIQKPAPPPQRIEREPEVISPGLSEERRPIEADNYPPTGGRVPHEPAFIRGLSSKTATGRVGIAGWTSPNTPVGGSIAGWHEVSGWFAIGFSATWDGPPPPSATQPAR